LGKQAVMTGCYGSGTAFANSCAVGNVGTVGAILQTFDLESTGNEVFYSGETGTLIEANVFVGPIFCQRLNQLATDKMSSRADGLYTVMTHQPATGRVRLEYEGLMAHGLNHQYWLTQSDACFVAICNRTGTLAIYNELENLFLSPQVDGPLMWTGDDLESWSTMRSPEQGCVETLSRFGYDFSIVRVPCAFRLLMQELQTINVQMRVITEETIDQLSRAPPTQNLLKVGKSVDELLQKSYKKQQLRTSASLEQQVVAQQGQQTVPQEATIVPPNALTTMANKIASMSASMSTALASAQHSLAAQADKGLSGLVGQVTTSVKDTLSGADVALPAAEENEVPPPVAPVAPITMAEKAAGKATPAEGSVMAVATEKALVEGSSDNNSFSQSTNSGGGLDGPSSSSKKKVIKLS
jgi:hypothetical protein